MPDLLLEIGTEEIPAGFVPPAIESLAALAAKGLQAADLAFGQVSATGTPRRLVLVVRDLADVQERVTREIAGPSVKAAYDAEGNPTKACLGFARSQNVEVGHLVVRETAKGSYVHALREEGGFPAMEILATLLPQILGAIPFPKSMRWGDGTVRFARPVHWILALLGGETIPFSFADIESGTVSRGHRFLSPGVFTVVDVDNYFRKAKNALVIVDHQGRRAMIAEALTREAEANGGRVVMDEALLDTVNFLVEYPVVLSGRFKEEYLQLPPEVLITAMKSHQKYFPVAHKESGSLLPLFLTVSNMKVEDPGLIRAGNERVLAARLADARFFWREDCKEPLAAKAEKLKKVLYQERLGTSWEKMERFSLLARHIAAQTGLGELQDVERAAFLCKADLVTEMVGEFPELQGIMGRYYALEAGEPAAVAEAIREHYLPRFAGDVLPATPAGMVVSLADKLDTIIGTFGIGQKPTGSEDPYGLRRLTIGVIAIIIEKQIQLDLTAVIEVGLRGLAGKIDRPAEEVAGEVLEFFRGRLQSLWVQEGFRPDVVDAVLAAGFSNLVDARMRLEALQAFCSRPEFEPLATAFRRVGNIIPEGYRGSVSPKLLREEAEKALHAAYRAHEKGLRDMRARKDYGQLLLDLAEMRPAVDAFFDQVMVMAEDEKVRANRLGLLLAIEGLFAEVADFRRIVVKP